MHKGKSIAMFCVPLLLSSMALGGSMLSVDYRNLVSRADITLNKPVAHSEEGMPIGNGRMGSLVWTKPTALHFQINRVDLYPRNAYSGPKGPTSPEPRPGESGTRVIRGKLVRTNDYHGGAGIVAINFGGEVFPALGTRQHLSLYDAQHTLEGQGLKARVLAWHARDVMAIEIEDQRKKPSAIQIDLSMLRPPVVVTAGNHTATSKVSTANGRIVLTQVFEEPAWTGFRDGDFYCSSAVVIGVIGRRAEAEIPNESTARLTIAAGKGTFTILIGSTATFDRQQDVIREAASHVKAAEGKEYKGLFAENQAWWHKFWSRSFVYLHSADQEADGIEQFYRSYLYVLGSSSRGKYPPNAVNHWCTDGDSMRWGSYIWWNQQRLIYRAPMQANHVELMEPLFDLYSEMYEAQAVAARQQWGTRGIWLAETVLPGGMLRLPDNLVSEMQDFMYERKRWEERSPEFDELTKRVRMSGSQWNWTGGSFFNAPLYGVVTTIFAHGARCADLYWLQYEYTLDDKWLRYRAYPMIKGVAEFYRNHPKVKKEQDGKYHIHNVNNHESMVGAQDTMEEQTAMRGVVWRAILASEILKVDAEMRPVWREFLDNLAPLPMVDQPNAVNHTPGVRAWAPGLKPYRNANPPREGGPTLRPCLDFDLWTLETKDPDLRQIVYTTYERMPQIKTLRKTGNLFEMVDPPNPAGWPPLPLLYAPSVEGAVRAEPPWPELSEMPRAAAALGLAADIKTMLPLQTLKYPRYMVNRMAYDEGYQTQNVEMSGSVSEALQLALMQSIPPGPGQPPVIRVFPAWPGEWDASFQLLARRGFLVSSAIEQGTIGFVEILSQFGGECRLRNPWKDAPATLYRNGKRAEELSESLLKFGTSRGENVVVVQKRSKPKQFRRNLPAPTALSK